ncbi:MAG: hypothetical protein U5S82_21360 [Gammaproteobacteria bacterium]|nr:hypothetical protein [Gammaproteobacteria bacterium]
MPELPDVEVYRRRLEGGALSRCLMEFTDGGRLAWHCPRCQHD